MIILVSGGRGFIGSNFIRYILTNLEIALEKVVNIDKQTYAGRGRNLEHMGIDRDSRLVDIIGDICNKGLVNEVFEVEKSDIVFNFAAESHVDRSIQDSEDFVMTNVAGTANLLDASRHHKVRRFVQISSDEVYGSIGEGSFSEDSRLEPSSPYAASKASAEHLAFSYSRTHGLGVVITRSANNYGEYQFPEKLLPLFITNLIEGKKVPLMYSQENPGLNVRDWLHVEDNCRAIWLVACAGKNGEAYNIPGENERTNIDMTRMLLKEFGLGEDRIERVEHRKGHDFRYSITGDKLKALGFEYKHHELEKSIGELVEWYKRNEGWWRRLK